MASSPVVEPSDLQTIRALREAHRGSAGCQIVRDSILPRRLADPWAIRVDGEVVGYAGVWREHFPGRLMKIVLYETARARHGGGHRTPALRGHPRRRRSRGSRRWVDTAPEDGRGNGSRASFVELSVSSGGRHDRLGGRSGGPMGRRGGRSSGRGGRDPHALQSALRRSLLGGGPPGARPGHRTLPRAEPAVRGPRRGADSSRAM